MKLDGIGVVVTGASQGLGAALSEALALAGAKVFLVARGANALEQVAEDIRARGGVAYAFAADISDKHAIHAIAGAAEALVGPVGLVVQNASTLGPVPLRPLLDTDCEALDDVLKTNLVGPFRLAKALLGPMVMRGRGLMVMVSSDAATSAYPGWGAYGVSKAALDHLGRIWAAELLGSGVRVLSIDPGEMDTAMHRDALPEADRTTLARPAQIAKAIISIVREETRSGVRLEASAAVAS